MNTHAQHENADGPPAPNGSASISLSEADRGMSSRLTSNQQILPVLHEDGLVIATPSDDQYPAWISVYRRYKDHYHLPAEAAADRRTFDWIVDPVHVLEGLVAHIGPELVGLLNFQEMPLPCRGTKTIWLHDLVVREDHAGRGIGRRLMERLFDIGASRHCTRVEWITESNNAPAKAIYDRLAEHQDWHFYEKALTPGA